MFDVLWVVESVWCRAVRVVSCRPPDADNPLQTDRDTRRDVPLLGERGAERAPWRYRGIPRACRGPPCFVGPPPRCVCEDFFYIFFFSPGCGWAVVCWCGVPCVRGNRGSVRCWLGGAVPLGQMGAR